MLDANAEAYPELYGITRLPASTAHSALRVNVQ